MELLEDRRLLAVGSGDAPVSHGILPVDDDPAGITVTRAVDAHGMFPGEMFDVGDNADDMTMADFNEDGHPDIACVNRVFNGTDGDETFTYLGAANAATIRGTRREHTATGFDSVTARAFDQVYANASEGGFDVARIYDTSDDEHLEVTGDTARLYRRNGDSLQLLYEAVAFERAKCYSTKGNGTTDIRDHVIDLHLFGWIEYGML